MSEETWKLNAEESLPPTVIKVAIIEDVRALREGFASLIGGTAGYHCTGNYRTMEEALANIGAALPDVALVDIGLPGMSGIEGVRLLKERYPALLLLIPYCQMVFFPNQIQLYILVLE